MLKIAVKKNFTKNKNFVKMCVHVSCVLLCELCVMVFPLP